MGRLIPFRRPGHERKEAPKGAIGPAPWDVIVYQEPSRPDPVPWPAYHGLHSRRQLGRKAVQVLLVLMWVALGVEWARAGRLELAAAGFAAAALGAGVAWRRLGAWEKAVRGEDAVARALAEARARYGELDEAIHLADLAIRWRGQRWQMDHVLLTRSAIFVLEAKSWFGPQLPLFGGRWLAGRGVRRSPLEQVRRQAALLEAWLAAQPGLARIPVIPLVVWAAPWKGAAPPPDGVVELPRLGVLIADRLVGRPPQIGRRQLRRLAACLAAADLGREVKGPCAG